MSLIFDRRGVNFAQMKYSRTEEMFERALRILERENGEDHISLVPCIDNLAQVLQADSKYKEAEKQLRRVSLAR